MKTFFLVLAYISIATLSYYIVINSDVDVLALKQENKELKQTIKILKEENEYLKKEINNLKDKASSFTTYQYLFFMSVLTIIIILYLIHKKYGMESQIK